MSKDRVYTGDANITTDNAILLRNTREELPIICEQKSTEKKKITKARLKNANKNGFNNNVGEVTNRCTNMYDVLSKFEKGTKEYDEMMCRIICMQGYQQEIIDSIKGIIPKKVPKYWYDYKDLKVQESDSNEIKEWKLFNQKLMANKKPYFFIYNYPKLMKKYKKYKKDCNVNCLFRFGLKVEELEEKHSEDFSLDDLINSDMSDEEIAKIKNRIEDELTFLKYYYLRLPVSMEKSLMNRLCWIVEKQLESIIVDSNEKEFDYSFMKSNITHNEDSKDSIEGLSGRFYDIWCSYKLDLRNLNNANRSENGGDRAIDKDVLIKKYQQIIYSECNNQYLVCDILLDLCYSSSGGKQFVWDICGDVIVENLLEKNGHSINIPEKVETPTKTSSLWQGSYYDLIKIKLDKEGECN